MSVGDIQAQARFFANLDIINLSSSVGLVVLNKLYREVAESFPWPELRKTSNISVSTTSGTGVYDWVSASTAVYTDVKSFEIGNDASNTKFIKLFIPESELEWNMASKLSDRIPTMYMRRNEGGSAKVELRPAPSYSGATMKVTGVTEPLELTDIDSETVFISELADDALARLVAAVYLKNYGGSKSSVKNNLEAASEKLKILFADNPLTLELTRSIAG